jgi:phosphoserine phosphatase RsbU/P
MRFRLKLLLLMLAVSVLPMVILTTFGFHTVRNMAAALSEEVQKGRLESARNEIQSLLNGSREALNMERERVAMALSFLSDVLRPKPSFRIGGRSLSERPANTAFPPVAVKGPSSRMCVITPEADLPVTAPQAAWLLQSEATFTAIAAHFGEMVLHQDLAYTSGVAASYPCPHANLRSGDVTQAGWYRAAFVESVFSWSRPFREVPTGRWVVSISALPEDDAGQTMGVASVTVALDKLLETILAFSNLPGRTRAFQRRVRLDGRYIQPGRPPIEGAFSGARGAASRGRDSAKPSAQSATQYPGPRYLRHVAFQRQNRRRLL